MSREDPAELPFRKFLRASGTTTSGIWARRLMLAFAGFALAFGALLVALHFRDKGVFTGKDMFTSKDMRAWTGRAAPDVIPAPPEPPPLVAQEGEGSLPVSPFSPFAMGASARFIRPLRFDPPYDPIDAKTFRASDVTITLTGIDAPERTAICEDFGKVRWICGIQARVALYYIIRADTLSCLRGREEPEAGKSLRGTCTIKGRDVATELVRTGYARAAGLPSREMAEAEAEARTALRGLWRGNWTIVPLQ